MTKDGITCHDCFQVMRVYYDRLVDDEDKAWLFAYLDEVTHSHLDIQFGLLFHHLDSDGDGKVCELDSHASQIIKPVIL